MALRMLSMEEMYLVAGGDAAAPIEEIGVVGYQPKQYFSTFDSWVTTLPKVTATLGGSAGTPFGGVSGSLAVTGTDANKDLKIDEPWELKNWYENGVKYASNIPGRTQATYTHAFN